MVTQGIADVIRTGQGCVRGHPCFRRCHAGCANTWVSGCMNSPKSQISMNIHHAQSVNYLNSPKWGNMADIIKYDNTLLGMCVFLF